MFITNELTPAEVIAELIKGDRLTIKATRRFRSLKHDRDLLPAFSQRLECILDFYQAYGNDVHETQSMRDEGVDILWRYKYKDEERRIGIQVKSNPEFEDWSKRGFKMIEKLKSQYSTAMNNARVDDYYIIICADAAAHRARIRTICSELKNFAHCTIIEPTYALGFYEKSGLDVAIRTARLLCSGDRTLKQAMREVDSIEPDVAFALISLLCRAFQDRSVVTQETLQDIWDDWLEYVGSDADSERSVADIVNELVGDGILDQDDVAYTIDYTELPASLCALYFGLRTAGWVALPELRDHIVALLEIKELA